MGDPDFLIDWLSANWDRLALIAIFVVVFWIAPLAIELLTGGGQRPMGDW